MNDYTPPPIQVSASSSGSQVTDAFRDILKILGSVLVTKGIVDESWVEPIIGAILVLGPFVWSQISVFRKHARTVLLAHAVSDKIAKVVE